MKAIKLDNVEYRHKVILKVIHGISWWCSLFRSEDWLCVLYSVRPALQPSRGRMWPFAYHLALRFLSAVSELLALRLPMFLACLWGQCGYSSDTPSPATSRRPAASRGFASQHRASCLSAYRWVLPFPRLSPERMGVFHPRKFPEETAHRTI